MLIYLHLLTELFRKDFSSFIRTNVDVFLSQSSPLNTLPRVMPEHIWTGSYKTYSVWDLNRTGCIAVTTYLIDEYSIYYEITMIEEKVQVSCIPEHGLIDVVLK